MIERAIGKVIADGHLLEGQAIAVDEHKGLGVEVEGLGLHGAGQQQRHGAAGIAAVA